MASVKQLSVVLKIMRCVTSLSIFCFTATRERLEVKLGGTENVSGHVSEMQKWHQ